MFEVAEDVSGGLVQVVIQMLASVIVVVFGGKTLSRIARLSQTPITRTDESIFVAINPSFDLIK